MESFAPVGMLEKMGAIEVGQAVGIRREVRGDPIEYYANSALVQVVHKKHEILWRAITRGWSKVAGGLISPGSVERVLHNREQLNMSELHALKVVGELGSNFAIGQRTILLLGDAHP